MLLNLISNLKDVKVVVIGDPILDAYISGRSTRLCPEAPVPVIDYEQTDHFLGGAANVAANVVKLGGSVKFCSVTGADNASNLLVSLLNDAGIQHDIYQDAGRATIEKIRIMSSDQLIARLDKGTIDPISEFSEQTLIKMLDRASSYMDVLIIADYNKGILTQQLCDCVARLRTEKKFLLIVDSKRLQFFAGLKPDLVKPNYQEAVNCIGSGALAKDRAAELSAQGALLFKRTGAAKMTVTLDKEGVLLFENGAFLGHALTPPVAGAQVSGAGDTFTAAVALALAGNATFKEAVHLACAAASIAVAKKNTAVCSQSELQAHFSKQKVYVNADELEALSASYRASGRRIVFTNGCFDILHSGHVNYLAEAKQLGDILIVGVNNDESIARLKGAERPINVLAGRVQVLGSLSSVDHVVSFGKEGDDGPDVLIAKVKPDIFVKGGDYRLADLPEASLVESLGGRVIILPFIAGYSTTSTITKIRQAAEKENGVDVG